MAEQHFSRRHPIYFALLYLAVLTIPIAMIHLPGVHYWYAWGGTATIAGYVVWGRERDWGALFVMWLLWPVPALMLITLAVRGRLGLLNPR